MNKQNGNVLFLILIAVALFAALSYAVTQSGRGSGGIEREQQMINQAVSEQCSAAVNYGVNKLKLIAGCAASEISYELADGSNANPSAPADKTCHVFDPAGAGVAVCGAYGPTGCNLAALALGEKCANGDIVYAGMSEGSRLYTTAADQGTFSWNDSFGDTGATSRTDGKANTDTLVALSGSYDGANACRAIGSEWYLPAYDELKVLYTNKVAIGGFDLSGTHPGGRYWSSSQYSNSEAFDLRFDNGNTARYQKTNVFAIRCVRR